MQRYDGEIGRGRRRTSNDSSSSRESSPGLARPKRQFSPTGSDGGEDPDPPNVQIQPPPPQERPLIRQAVAFASDQQPQNIITYEAAPPQILKGFLPGQQPVFLPKPPRVPKERPMPKRPRRTDPYTSQTTRFRIDTYDPTPSSEPPIAHGNGPYSSLYRGPVVPLNRGPSAPVENQPPSDRPMSSAPSSTSAAGMPAQTMPPARHPTRTVGAAPAAEAHSMNRTTSNHYAPGGRQNPPPTPSSSAQPQQQNNRYYRDTSQPPAPAAPSQYTPSPHYRNDYDKGVSQHYRNDHDKGAWGADSRQNSPSPPRDTQDNRRQNNSQSSARSRHSNAEPSQPSHHGQNDDPGPQRPKAPVRMVTLLIQDARSGTTDHQLAEVKVPLRLADSQGTSFWADARAICEQLQEGPSRIDGPARVYTMRGKYRQFVLRVTKDNVDEHFSCNVSVEGDRTVDLVVETLYPPGAPPQPPNIPRELLGSYGHNEDPGQMDVEEPQYIVGARKRLNSPSFDDYDGTASPPPSKRSNYPKHSRESTNYRNPQHLKPSRNQNSDSSPPKRRRPSPLQRPVYDSRPDDPPIPSSPQPNEAMFLKMLQTSIQDHNPSGYRNYFRCTVGYDVSDLLCQYEFFLKAINEFVGKPLGAYEDHVEECHLVKLMKVKEEGWVEECKETMKLLALYGDEKLPQYDPRITEMIKRKVDEEHKVQTRKEFLQLLREIDQKNKNTLRPEAPSRRASQDSGAEVVGERRSSKGMFVD